MFKNIKGQAGYLDQERKNRFLQTAVSFGIVLLILLIGYLYHGSRLNVLTVFAVVLCLPSARILLGLLMIFRHRSVPLETVTNLEPNSDCLTLVYETVLTSKDKVMPIMVWAISGSTIFGYGPDPKLDLAYTENYLKTNLKQQQYDYITLKIFSEFTPFRTRVEGLNNIARIDGQHQKEQEEAIKRIILSLSL